MNISAHFKKSYITLALSLAILLFSIGSVVLFAAPPSSGGYNPGETLDPDCTPDDPVYDCFVNISTGGGSSQWIDDGSDIYFEAGLVGIGTDTPTAQLSVEGDVSVQTVLSTATALFRQGDISVFPGLSEGLLGYVGDFTSEVGLMALDYNNGDPKFQLYMTGAVGTGGSGLNLWSPGDLSAVDQYFALQASPTYDPSISVGFEAQEDIDGLKAKMYYATPSTNLNVIEVGPNGVLINTNDFDQETKFNVNGLVLPRMAVDPVGENGAMYYNNVDNVFRVYQNGSWQDLVGGGGGSYSGTAGRFVVTDGSGNLTDSVDAQFESQNIYLNTDTASTNGQGTFQIGNINVSGFGAFNGVGLAHTYETPSGDPYTGNLFIGDAAPFNNIPIVRLGLRNDTSNDSAGLQIVDSSTLGGEFGLKLEYDSGSITGMSIQDGSIQFSINDVNTFSIPTSFGNSGYVLQSLGGSTAWVDTASFAGAVVRGGFGNNTLTSDINNVGGNDGSGNSHNIFLGTRAGEDASSAVNSVFLGNNAGYEATNASYSNIIGFLAGYQATNADSSNFIGRFAGAGATNATTSNFFGYHAGAGAVSAQRSNFIGYYAGNGATGVSYSNFIGDEAGLSATSAIYSNFIGIQAGSGATTASTSTFIGGYAGQNAANAQGSLFLGHQAGFSATNASNAIFIGLGAGIGDTVDNSNANEYSILIGRDTSTGGFSSSIALGLQATNTAENQFMIGSTTRPIEEMRIILDNIGGECVIDITGANCSSDETLKTDITDITNALDIVTQLDGVTYHWVNGDETTLKTPGFIAQDVKDILPEAVRYNENTGKYMMNYTQIIPYLVEAIKTLNTAVNTGVVTGAQVGELVVDRIRARELCLDDLCIDRADLEHILEKTNTSGSSFTPTPTENETSDPVVTNDVMPTDTPTETSHDVSDDIDSQGHTNTENPENTDPQAESSDDSQGQPEPAAEFVSEEPTTNADQSDTEAVSEPVL